MSEKTVRKGAELEIGFPPRFKIWYEEIEKMKKEVKKMGFLKRGKNSLITDFKNFLMRVQRDVESNLWMGIGFAINQELGKDVQSEFHYVFATLIRVFNNIIWKFEPDKMSEDLLNHLKREIEKLEDYSRRFYDIQSINATEEGKRRALEIIQDFKKKLWEFEKSMKPYCKE